jgi:flagellin
MAAIINTNVQSLTAQRHLGKSQNSMMTAMQRLSSGLRINSAKDDAAGLAIANRMSAQINGLNQAVRNANDGISLAQTAEGALDEATNILQRMRELAVQSANDTNTDSDRKNIQKEINQLQEELNRISDTTTFNNKTILDGTFTSAKFHVGSNADQTINVSVGNTRATAIGDEQINYADNIGTSVTVAATAGAATNGVAAQTFTVNGEGVSSTITVSAGMTASTIASNINAESGTTGVEATAKNSVTLQNLSADGSVSFQLSSRSATTTVEGTEATISASVTTTDLTNLAEAINDKTAQTGISAVLSDDKSAITLENSTGHNISVANFASSAAGNQTVDVVHTEAGATATDALTEGSTDSVQVAGSVELSSSKSYSVTTTGADVLNSAAGTTASTLSAVSDVDLSTQTGANNALSVIDQALNKLVAERAKMGAVQNRFEATISNLQSVAENTTAARSRIQDADFAAETAAMTRAQILQQAGTAMLAQANAAPQSVLSLLG